MTASRGRLGVLRATGVAVVVLCVGFPVAENAPASRTSTTRPAEQAGVGATIAQIAEIVNAFERNAALYEFVADSDRSRIEALLGEVAGLPETPHRDDIARVLYIRYASLDPAAAAAHALHHRTEPDVLAAVFRAWAHADLDAAVARAAELPTGARRDAARTILQLDLPTTDREVIAARLDVKLSIAEIDDVPGVHGSQPDEAYEVALARIGAMTDDEARRSELASVAVAWAATEPAQALAAVIDWDGVADDKDSLLYGIMVEWAQADPRAAVDWLLARDAAEFLDLVFPAYLQLAKTDSAGAEALVEALAGDSERRQARVGVLLATLDDGDLDRAVTVFAELGRQGQAMAVGDLGNRLARAAPERAFEWLLGLDEELRRETLEWTLRVIHQQDPALTKLLIQRVADPALRIEAARAAIDRVAFADPAETLRWVETLGAEEQYAPVVGDLFGEWLRWDPERASAALLRYPRGAARDIALRRFVGAHLASFDTTGAELFFDAIDSPHERRNAARALLRYYLDVDPNERKATVYERIAGADDG